MIIQETGSPDVTRAFRVSDTRPTPSTAMNGDLTDRSQQLLGGMVVPCSQVIASYPGIETLLEDPPEKKDDMVRVRWVMGHHEPERHEQGRSTCRCRSWADPNVDYFYGMELSKSKRMAEDAQHTLKDALANGEPEEVRRRFGLLR